MHLIDKYFWIFSIFLLPVLYIIIASCFYMVLYVWKKTKAGNYKIQINNISGKQFKREFFYSVISLIIFSAMGYIVYLLYYNDYSRIYLDLTGYGIVYLFISVILIILFHDMYFYWTHRLLHLNRWYQKIHIIHHLSINPSPFTSLSFHPMEAIIQAAVLPLAIMLIPIHPFSLVVFLLFMVYKNVKGHAGYEFTTKTYRDNKWNKWYSFSVHHNDHHLKGKNNYGLYFTIWDKIMNTFNNVK